MWYTLNTGAAFEVIPRLRSGLLGSQLRVYVWVSWSSPRGQPEVSLDGEASLRSRSPKPQLGRQLEVSRRSAGPLSKQRVGSEKVVKGCFVLGCVIQQGSCLARSFCARRLLHFLACAVSLSPPCLCELSMFGRGLRCFDFANHMPFSIILLVGCCFTCDVSLLSLSFSVFLCLSLSFSVFLCFSLSFSVLLCLSLSLSLFLFFFLSLSLSLCLSLSLAVSLSLSPSLSFSVLLSLSVCLCLCRRCCKKS